MTDQFILLVEDDPSDLELIMHAVRKIEELKTSDLSIAEDVELLKRQLQG